MNRLLDVIIKLDAHLVLCFTPHEYGIQQSWTKPCNTCRQRKWNLASVKTILSIEGLQQPTFHSSSTHHNSHAYRRKNESSTTPSLSEWRRFGGLENSSSWCYSRRANSKWELKGRILGREPGSSRRTLTAHRATLLDCVDRCRIDELR